MTAENNLLQFAKSTYTKEEIKAKGLTQIAKEYMMYMIDFQSRLVDDSFNSEILKRNIFNHINNQ